MSGLTFGQLVEHQQSATLSDDVVSAAAYEIPFGKHKGMTLMKLIEHEHSYCQWLLSQEESKNPNFNKTCENIKFLLDADKGVGQGGFLADGNMMPPQAKPKEALKVDGVELVAGEPVVIAVDPAKEEPTPMVVTTGNSEDIANGLLMGKLSDILAKVSEGEISFEFAEADIDRWLMMVAELDKGIDAFVIIETKHSKTSNNQRIKKIIPQVMMLKAKKGVIQNA